MEMNIGCKISISSSCCSKLIVNVHEKRMPYTLSNSQEKNFKYFIYPKTVNETWLRLWRTR